MSQEYHHTTDLKEHCSICGRPFKMFWEDAEEKNGRSETMHGFDKACYDCATLRNNGDPPKSLQQINEERKRLYSEE